MAESDGSTGKRDPHDQTRLAYAYLSELAASGEPYSDANMATRTGWKVGTVRTHRSKKWRAWVKPHAADIWTVSPSFEGVSEREFIDFHRQRTDYYASYSRSIHTGFVIYEFLLPLTRERELTRALDALFYEDTVRRLIREATLESFQPEFPEVAEMTEEDGLAVVVDFVANHFAGYSISHVSGRFRGGELASRAEAGSMLPQGKRYLVDETTAIVRFIVPLQKSSSVYESDNGFLEAVRRETQGYDFTKPMHEELARVRLTFFQLFAEAVVRTVKGEDEVWLLESGPEDRLYVWEKA